jgi:hypothetical protein
VLEEVEEFFLTRDPAKKPFLTRTRTAAGPSTASRVIIER